MSEIEKSNTNSITSNTSKIDIEKSEEEIAKIYDDEPVVSGARVKCSNQPNILAQVISKTWAYDKRNGNVALKDEDILLSPCTFGFCNKLKKVCMPQIEGNRWKCCDDRNLIAGRPGVMMSSFMVCIIGGGMISIVENGQIPAGLSLPYGTELTTMEIETLIRHLLSKVEWTDQQDIDNAEYIAKCMKEAGMNTRMSIEFFLLSCCPETGKGKNLQQINGTGKGFIQLTGLTPEQWKDLADHGNEWRKACGKEEIKWENTSPKQSEIEDAVIDRDKLAWEGSIYYWCILNITEKNSTPLNDYVAGYEDGSKGDYVQAGLYYAAECFVNGATSGKVATKMREGNINDYVIEINPTRNPRDYKIVEVDNDTNFWDAPNGTVERARVYMKYYDEEEYIWNFSQDIKDSWDMRY